MSAANQPEPEEIDIEVLNALDVIRRKNSLRNLVDVFTEAGVGQATAYRRIERPSKITVAELRAVAARFGVPLHVITEGELATLRWILDAKNPGPDGGPGVPVSYAPRDSNPEPVDCPIVPLTRRSPRQLPAAA